MTRRNSLYSIAFLVLLLAMTATAYGQKTWKDIQTVSELYDSYPSLVKEVFEPLDLDYPGLEGVKLAYERKDWVIAAEALLRYYRTSEIARELAREIPAPSELTMKDADTLLNYVFTIQNVRGRVPIGSDGHRDWYYKGPNNDREWAWLSNRHSQLARVMNVYFETGNVKYARFVDDFLKDFILKSMPYPAEKGTESIWRGLEVAARAKVWTRVFYGMSNSPYLSDATRLLILRSLPDHAHYNRNFHGGNNWLTMEISALSTIAAYFPELRESDAWLDYSIDAMVESMRDQVYPDGVQTELASHYHNVSLHNFELFKEICKKAGRSLPAYFENTIQDMYRYIAHAVRPDGHRILNNDGDRGSDRELILEGARKYQATDWEYIATNGLRGTVPSGGPSYFFPWAGQLVSRSGYGPNAHWSFFDVGPWGSGHQHNDKLHLSIAAFGRDLLVDAGRFAYTGAVAEKFRPYALSSAGHNLLLLDGKGQGRGPTHAQRPLTEEDVVITEDFDFAYGMFDSFLDLEGVASHSRSMMYVRNHFWVVVDRVVTDRPRTVDALWHWHPDCNPVVDRNRVQTDNSFGNLTIVPVDSEGWNVHQVRGQEDPVIQGWYSPEYNVYGPNTTSIYQMSISENSHFVWLLVPSEKPGVAASAAITESTEKAMTLEVEVAGDRWVLTIPQKGTDGVAMLRR